MKFIHLLSLFIAFCLTGCVNDNKVKEISFMLMSENESIGCEIPFKSSENEWKLEQLQFFVSQIKLQDKLGNWIEIPLEKNNYQTSNIALLGEHCSEKGAKSASGNWSLTLEKAVDVSQYQQIAFTLGVPFEENHVNPLTQESPLNNSSMFWVWQTGHKFIRLEMSHDDEFWLFHLGSTGCSAPSALRAPSKECLFPNQVNIQTELPKKSVGNILPLSFDLSALLKNITLNESNHCQAEATNKVCNQLMENIQKQNGNVVFKVNDVQ